MGSKAANKKVVVSFKLTALEKIELLEFATSRGKTINALVSTEIRKMLKNEQ